MKREQEITQDMLTELAKEIWEEAEKEPPLLLVFGTREKVEQWIKDFHKGIVDNFHKYIVDNFLNPPTKSYQELKEYFKEEKGD